jgi:hypothetical protein
MNPDRNTIHTHAQDFVVKDELLLPILKAFAQCRRSLHATRDDVFGLCVVIELSVAPTNSSSVVPSLHRTAPNTPLPLQVSSRGLWSVPYTKMGPEQNLRIVEDHFFSNGSTALFGPGPPRFVEVSWSHTFRHTTLGRTPLDE